MTETTKPLTPAKRKQAEAAKARLAAAIGWYWPSNSRKAHAYDADQQALCGKWFVLAPPSPLEPVTAKPGPDDCSGCRTKVDRLVELAGLL